MKHLPTTSKYSFILEMGVVVNKPLLQNLNYPGKPLVFLDLQRAECQRSHAFRAHTSIFSGVLTTYGWRKKLFRTGVNITNVASNEVLMFA